jgi:hypothetical protein
MSPLLLLSALGLAEAGSLSLRWPAGPLRYHAEAMVVLANGYWLYGAANVEARAGVIAATADLSCTTRPVGSQGGVLVDCLVDQANFQATGNPAEADKLQKISVEYSQLLPGKHIQVELKEDGQVRSVDIEGLPESGSRAGTIEESLRQLSRALMGPLLIQAPKDGLPPKKGWKQKGMPPTANVFWGDAAGTAQYTYELSGEVSGTARILAGGKGFLTAQAGDATKPAIDLVLAGDYRFDGAAGVVAWGEVQVSGMALPDALAVGPQNRFNYAAWAGRINADGTVEGKDGPRR